MGKGNKTEAITFLSKASLTEDETITQISKNLGASYKKKSYDTIKKNLTKRAKTFKFNLLVNTAEKQKICLYKAIA